MNNTTTKKKLVIAEDDRILAIILEKMASSLDFEILDISIAGKEAIRSIKENKPDLVFMDILLSDDTTGIDAMKKIREYSDVPVIYITAQSDPRVKKEAGSVGNAFYLLKPINIKELKSIIKKVQFAA